MRGICSRRARATSWRRPGIGSGAHGSEFGAGCGATVAASTTWFNRATAADPSATAWWSFTTTAIRSALSPSTTSMAHRGRSSGSGVAAYFAMASASARSSPGGASTTRLRWRVRSKSGSSTHTGWPRPSGTGTVRRRNGGSRINNWPKTAARVSNENPPAMLDTSHTATLMVCMWAVGVSEYRNLASRPDIVSTVQVSVPVVASVPGRSSPPASASEASMNSVTWPDHR